MSATLRIDGREIPFSEGQTIMDAALAAGLYIPHLCHNPEFSPHGSCRICTVRVDGREAAACTTAAAQGQEVANEDEQLNRYRRTLMEMLFVEGNHICPACEKSGNCQMQAVAYSTGMLAPTFTYFYPHREIDASHPEVVIDFDRCILCELCVRASRDVDGKSVFAIAGRGLRAHLIVDASSGRLGDTDFALSDRAAHVCPVGAILPKRHSYEVPGHRRYDQAPISVVGDVTTREQGDGHD